MILQDGPRGFVLGIAERGACGPNGWESEWYPAWIRKTQIGADVFWIDHRGEYGLMLARVPHSGFKLAA